MPSNDDDIGTNFRDVSFISKPVLPPGHKLDMFLQGRFKHQFDVICPRALEPKNDN